MMRSVGDAFVNAYLPILRKRRATPYGERERTFQNYRRGRYVEFNLVFDRGTHFGPPAANWRYGWQPEPGTHEAKLYTDFLRPRAWLDEPNEGTAP